MNPLDHHQPERVSCCHSLSSSSSDSNDHKNDTKNPKYSVEEKLSKRNKDIDAWLASDLEGLSIEERQALDAEIAGTTTATLTTADVAVQQHEENITMVQNRLKLFELEIDKIKPSSKVAYDRAKARIPEYVTDTEFQLMFLRADQFKVQKAATRIVQHFDMKLDLFGEDKLARAIAIEDLNSEDQASLQCGSVQFLEARDLRGRKVVCSFPEVMQYKSEQNFVRTLKYS